MMSGRAKIAGVVGDPIAHTLSPRLHSYWLARYGIDGAFVPLKVERHVFADVVLNLKRAGFAGLSVTVPHKIAAFALADGHDRDALAAGAVNLLLFHSDRIEGRNTDSEGLAASLREHLGGASLKDKTVAIMGAGGAARAAVIALDRLGASDIRIVARDIAKAENLARSVATTAHLSAHAWAAWPSAAKTAAMVVNATSAGMRGMPPLELALETLPKNAIVCDLVYDPLETQLLKNARARGHAALDGLGMLMHQAVPAFEAFYGIRPEVTPELRAELEKALDDG